LEKRWIKERGDFSNLHCPYPDRMRSHHDAEAPLRALISERVNFANNLKSIPDVYKRKSRRRTIYVHVPFCTRHCTFCNLRRFQRPPPNDYHKLIIKEIQTYSSYQYVKEGVYHAVYFGGGTPTTLTATGLREILQALKSNLTLAPDAELTIETTVSDLTEDKIAVFKEEGINRFSVGVQTFCDRGRRLLGRLGTGKHAAEKLASLLDEGFQNVGIDLIYNYPSQSEDDLKEDLKIMESLNLAGFSFYSLILLKGTPLHQMIKMGKCPPLGGLKQEWLFFEMILDYFLNRGFELLELTKLVQPGRDNYEYIRVRYENGDTLGLGAGAGGRLGNMAYMNPLDVEAYRQQVSSATGLPMMGFKVDNRYDFAYNIIGKLQFGRLNWSDLEYLSSGSKHLRQFVDKLAAMGLVQTDSRGFSLTRKGVFWGNNIAREFATILVKLLAKKEDYRHIHESAQNYSGAKKHHLRGEQAT